MNIVLIGFMGSGKSTVAKLLAKNLKRNLVSMDEYLLKFTDLKSIEEIFATRGETYFRELEIRTAKELKDQENLIIDCGGGVVMNKIIIDYLKEKGKVIFLDASLSEIKTRLKDDQKRPLWQQAEELFTLRQPLYQAYADLIISTNGETPASVTTKIISKLENLNK
ncbi:MAG: shikimate kinase [bacterium]